MKKYIFSLLVVFALVLGANSVLANSADSIYTYYTVDNKAIITGVTSKTDFSGEQVIPFTLEGCPVTEIYTSAFADCVNLERIVIPDSVTTIGNHAFYNCSALESIKIPESVTSISENTFDNCYNITNIYIYIRF